MFVCCEDGCNVSSRLWKFLGIYILVHMQYGLCLLIGDSFASSYRGPANGDSKVPRILVFVANSCSRLFPEPIAVLMKDRICTEASVVPATVLFGHLLLCIRYSCDCVICSPAPPFTVLLQSAVHTKISDSDC